MCACPQVSLNDSTAKGARYGPLHCKRALRHTPGSLYRVHSAVSTRVPPTTPPDPLYSVHSALSGSFLTQAATEALDTLGVYNHQSLLQVTRAPPCNPIRVLYTVTRTTLTMVVQPTPPYYVLL